MKKKSNIWTIMRKEFARFFGDKRMAFTTILMPGLLIYIMYSFMGTALTNMYTVSDDFKPIIYIMNEPESVKSMMTGAQLEAEEINSVTQRDDIIDSMKDKNCETNLLVVFPEEFDNKVASYDNMTSTIPAENIEIYYNSASTESSNAYQMFYAMMDQYEDTMTNKFDINGGDAQYDLASKEDTSGQIFASMLPMLMMIFLFSGCMGIAPESIAGEKERGTMATLLVTPLRRRELAIGKIISLSCIALLSGVSSFIGTFASLPKLMGGSDTGMSMDIYSPIDFGYLFLIILSTILIIVGLICIISTYAKSVKEAGTLITPLMLVTMVIGITAMFGNGAQTALYYYMIPLYNSVQSMVGIFLLNYNPVNVMTSIIANTVFMGICIFILSKMFNSEKIIFNK